MSTLGRYAELAREHWRQYLPDDYFALADPDEFFQEIEAEARRQVDDLTDEPTPPGETFAERVTRMAARRQMAEEIVMHDLILTAPSSPTQ